MGGEGRGGMQGGEGRRKGKGKGGKGREGKRKEGKKKEEKKRKEKRKSSFDPTPTGL